MVFNISELKTNVCINNNVFNDKDDYELVRN